MEFDFAELAIKGRSSKGNILTKNPIKQITKREDGVSTLGARDIWYDETVKRLNTDERGQYLGAFIGDDRILSIMTNGEMKLSSFELSTHFDEELRMIRKFNPEEVISTVYFDGESEKHYLKRFTLEADMPPNKRFSILNEHPASKVMFILFDELPRLQLTFKPNSKGKVVEAEEINVADFIAVKSYKAKGKRLSIHEIEQIETLEPLKVETSAEETNGQTEESEEMVTDVDTLDSSEVTIEETPADASPPEQPQSDPEDKPADEKQSGKNNEPPLQMELEF
jgi:topoisomerase IV subunit A